MDLPPFLEKETSSIPGAAAYISNNGSTEIPGAETSSYIVNTTNKPSALQFSIMSGWDARGRWLLLMVRKQYVNLWWTGEKIDWKIGSVAVSSDSHT